MNKRITVLLLGIMVLSWACQEAAVKPVQWKDRFDQALPLLGHRNWILVVDKAFPEQNAPGMVYINTDERLLPVLEYVMKQVRHSGHVNPVIYRDRELEYINEDQAKGVKQFVAGSAKIFGDGQVQTLLHDSVFSKLGAASDLFKVLVLKTNETIPYTSVFLQLDCAYWDAANEAKLRTAMSK